MGISPRLSASILRSSMSQQMTSLPKSASPAPVTRPTYPVPMTAISKWSSGWDRITVGVRGGAPATLGTGRAAARPYGGDCVVVVVAAAAVVVTGTSGGAASLLFVDG